MTPIEPNDHHLEQEHGPIPINHDRCRSFAGPVRELIDELRRISDMGCAPAKCTTNRFKMWKDDRDLYFEIDSRSRTKIDADITILNNKLYVRVSI